MPTKPTTIGGSVSDDVLCRSMIEVANGQFGRLQQWSAAHAGGNQ
jgi:hypothetical protein